MNPTRRPDTPVEDDDDLTEIVRAEVIRVDGVLGPANGIPTLFMKSLPTPHITEATTMTTTSPPTDREVWDGAARFFQAAQRAHAGPGPVAKGRVQPASRPSSTALQPDALLKAAQADVARDEPQLAPAPSAALARQRAGQAGIDAVNTMYKASMGNAGNQPNQAAFNLRPPAGSMMDPARPDIDDAARHQGAGAQGTLSPSQAPDPLYAGFAGGPGTAAMNPGADDVRKAQQAAEADRAGDLGGTSRAIAGIRDPAFKNQLNARWWAGRDLLTGAPRVAR